MNRNQRPTYLQNQDHVQKAIENHPSEVSMKGLMKITNLTYTAIQSATAALRKKGRIKCEKRGNKLLFSKN